MAQYPFLSDEWMEEARKIREAHRGEGSQTPHQVKMNQIITDVPFGEGTIHAHMDSSSGEIELDLGHLDTADVTVTVDYETAKAIFVNGDPQAGMQAFMAGKIKVAGDMTKLMVLGQTPPDAAALEVQRQIKEITA